MAFDPLETPIDFVLVNGQRTPGIAEVTDADAEVHWDSRQGYGLSGAFPIGGWNELVKFQINIRLITHQDWVAWDAFRRIVKKAPAGKYPRSLNVTHPWLAMQDVSAAVVTGVYQPKPIDDDTVWLARIGMLEWRRPKLQLVKPEAAAPTAPLDPIDAQILSNQQQIEKLSKG